MLNTPNPTRNVAQRLADSARARPDQVAIAFPRGYRRGRRQYATVSFAELDADVTCLARGLVNISVQPGTRLALLIRPSIDFIALVFAALRCGAVSILIDPGMGRRNLLRCLDESRPEGFVAIPLVHAVRKLLGSRYSAARLNVTVGRRWFWGGATIAALRQIGAQSNAPLPTTTSEDPAAIIFTTGSTGPPKGVLYRHGMFDAQVTQLRDFYRIAPGEVDLPGFPLFGLFNCAMGVTTVIPDMDPSRPARVDPRKIIEAARDWHVTQAFGSPAIWNRVGQYCAETGEKIPTLRRVLSAGAPVPAHVLERMKACIHPDGDVHTPYGATESLPVASISAREVLAETRVQTDRGAGVCVGRRFSAIDWKVIRIVDGPIGSMDCIEELPPGEIGELIVRGPQVTREYATRTDWNARAKIADGATIWHRIGDAGYLDPRERFWFCGRVAHRVLTANATMYTIPCEAVFNCHPRIFRSALVGIGPAGQQRPVLIAEPQPDCWPRSRRRAKRCSANCVKSKLRSNIPAIQTILLHRSLPVDIRHNAKIFREKLALWAATQVGATPVESRL